MSTRNRWILPGLAAGAILAMLAVPATRQVMRTQLDSRTSSALGPGGGADGRAQRLKYLANRPTDMDTQIAGAVQDAEGLASQSHRSTHTEAAGRLSARFPGSPAAQAAVIRVLCRFDLGFDWAANRAWPGVLGEGKEPPARPDAATLEAVEAGLVAARRGEAADPENALFPFFRAGLLAVLGRRAEADGALLRVGRCSTFDDYVRNEATGALDISRHAYGETDVVSDVVVVSAILFPHMAKVREIGRIFQAEAVSLESSGETGRAADLRLALMRVGSLMRRDASSAIGALVGVALTGLAQRGHPGAPEEQDKSLERKERRFAGLNHFAEYLERLGRDRDARWVRNEAESGRTAQDIVRQGASRLDLLALVVRWALPWSTGAYALRGAFFLLLLGALAWLASRSASIRQDLPLPLPSVMGMLLTAACLAAAPAAISALGIAPSLVLVTGILVAATVAAVALHQFRPFALGALAPPLVVAVMYFAGFARGPMLLRVAPYIAAEGNPPDTVWFPAWADVVLPAALVLWLVARSLAKRVPVSVGVVKGMASLAVPIASVLILLNAALSVPTIRAERQLRTTLGRIIEHEGPEFARVLGRQWPD